MRAVTFRPPAPAPASSRTETRSSDRGEPGTIPTPSARDPASRPRTTAPRGGAGKPGCRGSGRGRRRSPSPVASPRGPHRPRCCSRSRRSARAPRGSGRRRRRRRRRPRPRRGSRLRSADSRRWPRCSPRYPRAGRGPLADAGGGEREARERPRHAAAPARSSRRARRRARPDRPRPTVSGGRPLTRPCPWPATWLRMRWSRKSGTTTSCAKRPGLERSSSR